MLMLWFIVGFITYLILAIHDFFVNGEGIEDDELATLVWCTLLGYYSASMMLRMFYYWYVKGIPLPEQEDENDD